MCVGEGTAERMALPLGNWRTQEEEAGLARWWDSSISGTFTERLCSTQLATRIRILKLKTEVPAREIGSMRSSSLNWKWLRFI